MGPGVRIECDVGGIASALDRRGVAVRDDGPALLTDRMRPWRGPVILIVQSGTDVPAALDDGAADAVVADAPPEEIAARIAARLRLTHPPIGIGDLLIDRIARHVTRAGRSLRLLPREYALLDHLAAHAGQTVPRDALLLAVWGLRFDPRHQSGRCPCVAAAREAGPGFRDRSAAHRKRDRLSPRRGVA